VGRLSRYFNDFLANLDSLVLEIRGSLDATLQIQNDLGANTDETVAALSEMTANIDSARRQMDILSETIGTSGEVVTGIVGQIERTIHNVEGQGAMVEQTTASVTELLASIENVTTITQREKESTDKLVRTAKRGGERLRQTTDVISEIEKRIEKIREFLTIINDIAAQTNLLAMNAAIEAAHAGDSGRGFAVVAGEIRKLAEDSGVSAKNISGVLEEIINGIQNAVAVSRETILAFSEIDREVNQAANSLDEISAAMDEMNTGSREIHEAVGSLNSVSQELVKDAQEMKAGSNELNSEMGKISDVANVVNAAMSEIRQGIHAINSTMNQVSQLSDTLGGNAQDLDSKISRFKTSAPIETTLVES
jgi:methyl-accepting chemotaxis protein